MYIQRPERNNQYLPGSTGKYVYAGKEYCTVQEYGCGIGEEGDVWELYVFAGGDVGVALK